MNYAFYIVNKTRNGVKNVCLVHKKNPFDGLDAEDFDYDDWWYHKHYIVGRFGNCYHTVPRASLQSDIDSCCDVRLFKSDVRSKLNVDRKKTRAKALTPRHRKDKAKIRRSFVALSDIPPPNLVPTTPSNRVKRSNKVKLRNLYVTEAIDDLPKNLNRHPRVVCQALPEVCVEIIMTFLPFLYMSNAQLYKFIEFEGARKVLSSRNLLNWPGVGYDNGCVLRNYLRDAWMPCFRGREADLGHYVPEVTWVPVRTEFEHFWDLRRQFLFQLPWKSGSTHFRVLQAKYNETKVVASVMTLVCQNIVDSSTRVRARVFLFRPEAGVVPPHDMSLVALACKNNRMQWYRTSVYYVYPTSSEGRGMHYLAKFRNNKRCSEIHLANAALSARECVVQGILIGDFGVKADNNKEIFRKFYSWMSLVMADPKLSTIIHATMLLVDIDDGLYESLLLFVESAIDRALKFRLPESSMSPVRFERTPSMGLDCEDDATLSQTSDKVKTQGPAFADRVHEAWQSLFGTFKAIRGSSVWIKASRVLSVAVIAPVLKLTGNGHLIDAVVLWIGEHGIIFESVYSCIDLLSEFLSSGFAACKAGDFSKFFRPDPWVAWVEDASFFVNNHANTQLMFERGFIDDGVYNEACIAKAKQLRTDGFAMLASLKASKDPAAYGMVQMLSSLDDVLALMQARDLGSVTRVAPFSVFVAGVPAISKTEILHGIVGTVAHTLHVSLAPTNIIEVTDGVARQDNLEDQEIITCGELVSLKPELAVSAVDWMQINDSNSMMINKAALKDKGRHWLKAKICVGASNFHDLQHQDKYYSCTALLRKWRVHVKPYLRGQSPVHLEHYDQAWLNTNVAFFCFLPIPVDNNTINLQMIDAEGEYMLGEVYNVTMTNWTNFPEGRLGKALNYEEMLACMSKRAIKYIAKETMARAARLHYDVYKICVRHQRAYRFCGCPSDGSVPSCDLEVQGTLEVCTGVLVVNLWGMLYCLIVWITRFGAVAQAEVSSGFAGLSLRIDHAVRHLEHTAETTVELATIRLKNVGTTWWIVYERMLRGVWDRTKAYYQNLLWQTGINALKFIVPLAGGWLLYRRLMSPAPEKTEKQGGWQTPDIRVYEMHNTALGMRPLDTPPPTWSHPTTRITTAQAAVKYDVWKLKTRQLSEIAKIRKRFEQRLFRMCLVGDKGAGFCLQISDAKFLTTGHVWNKFLMSGKDVVGLALKGLHEGPFCRDRTVWVRRSDVKDLGSDYAVFTASVSMGPDLSQYGVSPSVGRALEGPGQLLRINPDGSPEWESVVLFYDCVNAPSSTGRPKEPGYGYNTTSAVDGVCGQAVFSTIGETFTFVGIHQAGVASTVGFCSIFDPDTLKGLPRRHLIHEENDLFSGTAVPTIDVMPQSKICYLEGPLYGSIYGTMPKYLESNPKSVIRKTPLYDVLKPEEVIPVLGDFEHEGAWISPGLAKLHKIMTFKPAIHPDLTDWAVVDLATDLLPFIPEDLEPYPLSWAINGFPGVNAMRMDTAVGPPLSGKKGDHFVDIDGARYPDAEIMAAQLSNRASWRAGKSTKLLIKNFPKDEVIKPAKMFNAKARGVGAVGTAFIMDCRMMLMPFFDQIRNARERGEIAIGVNAASPEWASMLDDLMRFRNALALDADSYDAYQALLEYACQVIEILALRCPKYRQFVWIIRGIFLELMDYYFIVKGDVFRIFLALASGLLGTAELNSICMCLYWRLVYAIVARREKFPGPYLQDIPYTGTLDVLCSHTPIRLNLCLPKFNVHCCLKVYGDDNAITMSDLMRASTPDAHEFIEIFQALGMPMTSADKTSRLAWTTPLQLEFLKRTFRIEGVHVLAPLREGSIMKAFSFDKGGPIEQSCARMRDVFRNADMQFWMHGEDRYVRWLREREVLLRILESDGSGMYKSVRVGLPNLTWSDILTAYEAGEYCDWTL
jgi:hypothetical protein